MMCFGIKDLEMYSEPCQASKKELFAKIIKRHLAVNYIPKKLHFPYSVGF